jgi:hypothetical protein
MDASISCFKPIDAILARLPALSQHRPPRRSKFPDSTAVARLHGGLASPRAPCRRLSFSSAPFPILLQMAKPPLALRRRGGAMVDARDRHVQFCLCQTASGVTSVAKRRGICKPFLSRNALQVYLGARMKLTPQLGRRSRRILAIC